MYSYRGMRPGRGSAVAAVTAVALLVTIGTALAPGGAAGADPRDDKKRVDAEVAKASSILEGATERAQEAARRLAAATAALPAAQELVAETKGEVIAAQVIAETARRKAEAAQGAVTTAQARYQAADAKVLAGKAQVAQVLSATYMGSDVANLNVLIGAGPLDVFERYGYVDRVVSTQRTTVRGFLGALTAAKQVQNDATLTQRAADDARLKADDAVEAARRAQAQAQEASAHVAALAAERAAALQVAQDERAASLAKYKEAKAEAAKIQRELAAWEARNSGSSSSDAAPALRPGARFLMPARGWKSSDFGSRYDPYYHVWQLHAGVDIAADGGDPIFAAADGVVIRAGWNDGGYGNYTCISHGRYGSRGLSTCYAHQSAILVSPGQRVRRGQTIGRVGTTGASTGNHLHFEVRLDGAPVQPLNWLPSCFC
jgi:murein DD-endopeptidase MepM/ murein hydrolase activator NlpD